jgi:hypothetical protein
MTLFEAEDSNATVGRKRGRQQDPDVFVMPRHAFSLRSLDVLLRAVLEDRAPAHQAALNRSFIIPMDFFLMKKIGNILHHSY